MTIRNRIFMTYLMLIAIIVLYAHCVFMRVL